MRFNAGLVPMPPIKKWKTSTQLRALQSSSCAAAAASEATPSWLLCFRLRRLGALLLLLLVVGAQSSAPGSWCRKDGRNLVAFSWRLFWNAPHRRQQGRLPWSTEKIQQHQFPLPTPRAVVHEHFMRLALEQAQWAAQRGEVPVGALVVRNTTNTNNNNNNNNHNNNNSIITTTHQQYEILAAQHNRVEARHDASAHAELLALREAGRTLKNWRLQQHNHHGSSPTTTTTATTLYSTLEPCPLCLSACLAFRVSHLVYGAPDHRLGAVETYVPLLHVLSPHPFHNLTSVTSGIRAQECGDVLRAFFQQQRRRTKSRRAREKQQQQHKQQHDLHSSNHNTVVSWWQRWRARRRGR